MTAAGNRPDRVPLRAGSPGSARAWLDSYDGRECVVFEVEDNDADRGALSPADSETLERAAQEALLRRLPLVGFIASSGADIDSGIAATMGWGRVAKAVVGCSGQVPTIFCATGPAVSGPALLLGLADIAIATEDSYAFVTGPRMVGQFTGEVISNQTLGGAGQLARRSGVAAFLVDDKDAASEVVGALLSLLPAHADELPPRWAVDDPADRPTPELRDLLPDSPLGSYDVRDVARAVADDGDLLEYKADWAANLVCAFATVAGRPVGILANQPQTLAGTLDIACSQKGARFVSFCDAFNLPLVTFVGHLGLPARQGPGVAWHHSPRRPAGLRLRPGHRGSGERDPAEVLRRGLHRDGLPPHGKRHRPGLALGGGRGDGGPGSGGDRPPQGQPGGTSRARSGLRRALPQPLHCRGAGLHRRGDRPG